MASSRDGETHELMHTRRKRLHKEFVSPMLPISKRSHIEKSLAWSAMSEEGGRQNPDTLPAPRHNVPAPKRSGAAGDLLDTQSLLQERDALKKKLKMAEEQLRKLHMVKTYRHKTNLEQLATLTRKWRGVAQEAADHLLTNCHTQPTPSMADLLSLLHIDPFLIHYSLEEEAFY